MLVRDWLLSFPQGVMDVHGAALAPPAHSLSLLPYLFIYFVHLWVCTPMCVHGRVTWLKQGGEKVGQNRGRWEFQNMCKEASI